MNDPISPRPPWADDTMPIPDIAKSEQLLSETRAASFAIKTEAAKREGDEAPIYDPEFEANFWYEISLIFGYANHIPFPSPDYFTSYEKVQEACKLYIDRERHIYGVGETQ